MDKIKIELGSREVGFKIPDSYAMRYDLLAAIGDNVRRGCGAILGVCWFDRGAPARVAAEGAPPVRLEPKHYAHDLHTFGGAVYDVLRERSYTDDQIFRAGLDLQARIVASLGFVAGAEDLADFTEESGDTSTS